MNLRLRDEMGLTTTGLVAIMVLAFALLVGAAFAWDRHEASACAAKGGKIVETGETYTTTTMAGKVPVTTTHHVTECHVPG